MLARFSTIWDSARDSLWALPLIMAGAGGGLALLALGVRLPEASQAAWLYSGDAAQASAFASSLVSAMITLTALAFSITMIVLTLAAQQLGPRLIRLSMGDLQTQFSLGLFLATDLYLLLLLRALHGVDDGRAPNLAISGGTLLALLSVITLLFFVHALARSIVADHAIARVGAALDQAIARAFPATNEASPTPPRGGHALTLDKSGYISRIDHAALVKAARKHDATIVLACSPGAHVLQGETFAWTHGVGADAMEDIVRGAIVIGPERTEGQDPEWSMRQLEEIALRALSPGINDEFTAMAVIDRLAAAFALLIQRCDAPQAWGDRDGAARLFGPAPTFALMLDKAFDQIAESGGDKQRVLLRLATTLEKLAALASPRHARAIERQADIIGAVAQRGMKDRRALGEIEAALDAARARLRDGAPAQRTARAPA